MDISNILSNAVQLERGVSALYADIMTDTDNAQVIRILKILSSESEAHARQLESRYGIFGKSEAVGEGVSGLLSVLSGRISKLKEKANPIEVLRGGIEIEKHMEQLYEQLAASFESEGQTGEPSDEVYKKGTLRASEVFRGIAGDERKHQKALQRLVSRIAEEGWGS